MELEYTCVAWDEDDLGIPGIPENLDWPEWIEAYSTQKEQRDIIVAHAGGNI